MVKLFRLMLEVRPRELCRKNSSVSSAFQSIELVNRKPEPFAFKLTPRSSTHEETLRREWSDVQRQL